MIKAKIRNPELKILSLQKKGFPIGMMDVDVCPSLFTNADEGAISVNGLISFAPTVGVSTCPIVGTAYAVSEENIRLKDYTAVGAIFLGTLGKVFDLDPPIKIYSGNVNGEYFSIKSSVDPRNNDDEDDVERYRSYNIQTFRNKLVMELALPNLPLTLYKVLGHRTKELIAVIASFGIISEANLLDAAKHSLDIWSRVNKIYRGVQ